MKSVMVKIESCSECKLCDESYYPDAYCAHRDFPRKENGKYSELEVDFYSEVDPRCPYAKEDYNK